MSLTWRGQDLAGVEDSNHPTVGQELTPQLYRGACNKLRPSKMLGRSTSGADNAASHESSTVPV